MPIVLTSASFDDGSPIPARHTADGADLSPPLAWSGIPSGTAELALLCDDPDAPRAEPWVHWVLFGIPTVVAGLPEGLPASRTLSLPGGAQGSNDFGRIGYGGPSPPRGHGVHHYHFRLLALDRALDLRPGATKRDLLAASRGHVLGEGLLTGTYRR
jgi:Raf kinase inhibitor-like YbhB/YbcL family protein